MTAWIAHRQVLALAGTPALAWIAGPRAAGRLRPTPGQTEGPFCPVEVPADSDADLLRNGALAYHRGVETWIDGRVSDVDGALHGAHPAHPCEGAAG